jgi:hypothetical protein
MAKSLEELILEFARQARNQLAAEAESKKNQGIRPVKWQGFNEDGNPIVKDGDKTRAVRGVGNTGQVKNTKLIYDEENSVEYKRTKKERQPSAITRPEVKSAAVRAKPRAFIHPVEIFEFEGAEFLEKMLVGDTIIAYRRLALARPRILYETFYETIEQLDLAQNGGSINRYISSVDRADIGKIHCGSTSCPPDGTTNLYGVSPGNIFSVIIFYGQAEIFQASYEIFLIDPRMEATIGNMTESFEHVSEDFTGGVGYYNIDIVNFGKRYSTDFEITVSGLKTVAYLGSLSYRTFVHTLFLANEAKYYYTFANGETTGTRVVDLSSILEGDFYQHYKIHEYRTRIIVGDEEQVVLYTVFFVVVIDTENEYRDEYDINSTGTNYRVVGGVGKFTPYFIHTKLNLSTGQLSSKTTQASVNPNNPSSGIDIVNIFGYTSIPNANKATLSAEFPFGCMCIYHIDRSGLYSYDSQTWSSQWDKGTSYGFDNGGVFDVVDVSPIFSQAYEEDWISNIVWDNTGYAANDYSTDYANIIDFLNLSYYNGVFYGYKNGPFIRYDTSLINLPCANPRTSDNVKNEYNYGDLPSTLNYTQMLSILNSMSQDTYDNLLDLTDWGQYNATLEFQYWQSTDPTSYKWYGPLFPIDIPQTAYVVCYDRHSTDEYYYQLLSGRNLDYILNDPIGYNTVPLESYQIISGESNLTTKFAHNFAVNDTVSITGTEVMDGTYTVTEVTTNLNFKVSVTLGNTNGLVATNGTATKQ